MILLKKQKNVFFDENALLVSDPNHSSEEEDRFILPRLSKKCHMSLECHCYRENDTIRLISARKANRKEAQQYEERLWEMIMILPTQSRIHTQTDWRNRLRFVLMMQSSPTSKKWLIRQECHIRTLSTTIFWIASRITNRWRFPFPIKGWLQKNCLPWGRSKVLQSFPFVWSQYNTKHQNAFIYSSTWSLWNMCLL